MLARVLALEIVLLVGLAVWWLGCRPMAAQTPRQEWCAEHVCPACEQCECSR